MKDLTIAELREKYPKLDEYLNVQHNECIETKSDLEGRIRSLEAALRVQEVINDALKIELHGEYESFMRRAISFAEQY